MSLHTEVTVHCDDCGKWEPCNGGLGGKDSAAFAAARKRSGWTSGKNEEGYRWDHCPACTIERARRE